jgi:hypothetical protein
LDANEGSQNEILGGVSDQLGSVHLAAAAWSPTDLTIIELKMTGTETLVLKNTSSGPLSLSNYSLQYFNKNVPTSFASPTSTQQLPNITLPAGQSVLFNSDNAAVCGAAAVVNLSFSLSDTSGYIDVTKVVSQPDGSLLFTPQDHASWTSTTTGADILKVPSNTVDPAAVWYRGLTDGTWKQAELSGDCKLVTTLITPADTPTYIQWADGTAPPAVIMSTDSSDSPTPTTGTIPEPDIGLAPPQITELLPNPNGSGADASDEFVELYNPNNVSFDLSGFKLSTGLTATHSYIFPAGTSVGPKSFQAFYSDDTNLTLSNSGSEAFLFDPLGTQISETDAYGTAKDGQAWALANGSWYWTTTPTPNSSNVISSSSSSSKTTSSKSSAKPKTSSTKAAAKVKAASTAKGSKGSATSSNTITPLASKTTSLHPRVLAAIGLLVILYAAYEYRHDLANQLYRFRRYREARRGAGQTSS